MYGSSSILDRYLDSIQIVLLDTIRQYLDSISKNKYLYMLTICILDTYLVNNIIRQRDNQILFIINLCKYTFLGLRYIDE